MCDELETRGLPLVADRDEAWRNFAGWRVNYDASLHGLLDELRMDAGEWFGDATVVPIEGRPARRAAQSKTNPS